MEWLERVEWVDSAGEGGSGNESVDVAGALVFIGGMEIEMGGRGGEEDAL